MAVSREFSSPTPPPEMVDLQQTTMWPATTQALVRTDQRRQILRPTNELEQVLKKENTFADLQKFEELMRFSQLGVSHKDSLARLWESKQANAVTLLREHIDTLRHRRIEAERLKKEILDEYTYEHTTPAVDEQMLEPVSIGEGFICDERTSSYNYIPDSASSLSEYEGENAWEYWREKAKLLNDLLSESLQREESLSMKIQENGAIGLPSRLSTELHQQFERFDNFLRFALRRAPVVIAHQDTELRYLFIHNAFPTLTEEEVIGKTDEEIYQGMGVPELMEFKREVIRTGFPDKKEIKFDTNMFGQKTFMIAVEPVFGTDNVCIGINYVAMDVTVQVAKREKLARVEEDYAVQVAMESELSKTIHITEETMRAKQLLATMSHEIRSPLAGVVSTATVLARTSLNEEQKPLVDLMVQSGEVVLQLINDILDLSKVEAGAMKFEAKKFRFREVVKHVLEIAMASVTAESKNLHLEGDIADDVPLEVIGDVLRIRQVLTNLVSNAVKFTRNGKVSVAVRVGPSSTTGNSASEVLQSCEDNVRGKSQQTLEHGALPSLVRPSTPFQLPHNFQGNGSAERYLEESPLSSNVEMFMNSKHSGLAAGSQDMADITSRRRHSQFCDVRGLGAVDALECRQSYPMSDGAVKCLDQQQTGEESSLPPMVLKEPVDLETLTNMEENMEEDNEDVIWIHSRIIDTGIGIPEEAILGLFQRYAQASTTHARKYGGTGLGLAISKELVELMGGTISVISKVNEGSTFSFQLPLRVVKPMASTALCSSEPKSMINKAHDILMASKLPGSLHFKSNKDTRSSFPLGPSSKSSGRRHKKVLHSLRAPHAPNRMGFDKGKSSNIIFTNKQEVLSTLSNGRPEDAEAQPVQIEEHGLHHSSDRILHMKSSGDFMQAVSHGGERCSSTDSGAQQHPKMGFLVNWVSGQLTDMCQPTCKWLPPQQGHARIGKEQISERSLAADEPTSMTLSGVKHLRPYKILLAEDNQVNIKVTMHMMSTLGYELKVVNNGAEAIEALQESSYNLVLMDVYMPVMDGLEATRRIRRYEAIGSWADADEAGGSSRGENTANNIRQEGLPPRSDKGRSRKSRIPIIAMTANALSDNIQDCYKHGMDSFIAKPVNLDKLEEVLNHWLPNVGHQF